MERGHSMGVVMWDTPLLLEGQLGKMSGVVENACVWKVSFYLALGVHGGAHHPPGQRGAGPPGRRCLAGGGEPERGGGLGSQGADEPPKLPMGAPESG